MQELRLIPESRRDAVREALRASLGAPVVDLDPIRGGVSGAHIFRLVVRERTYVLRIEPERIALHDRKRHYACMEAAATAGAAPAIHYADAASGVSIMDFVSGLPLSGHPGGDAAIAQSLGALIAKVQAALPFPILGDYPEMLALMLADLGKSNLLAAGQLERLAAGLIRIRSALPWNRGTMVSSHNDPNPRNILFDGERMWPVDWELACLNDPLVDVAILTTELVEGRALEDALLQATFGVAPDRYLRARLIVIRLLTRLGYGCVVLNSLTTVLQSIPDVGAAARSPRAFREAVTEGRLGPGTPQTAYAFGKMSLAAFVNGVTASEFNEILELASKPISTPA